MASSTTNDKEIARNPHPPKGLGRDGPITLLLLLDLVSVALPTYVIVFMAGSTSLQAPTQAPFLPAHRRAPKYCFVFLFLISTFLTFPICINRLRWWNSRE